MGKLGALPNPATGASDTNNDNLPDARFYAHYLASRLKDRPNVLWILGGDRPPRLSALPEYDRQSIARSTGFSQP